jgi:exosome complex protein LRP1
LRIYSTGSNGFTAYLRLNGVKAKDHPVFKELTRVKQYFEKIKVVEEGPTKPRENLSLNRQAAGRVIKHALVRASHTNGNR